MLIWGMVQKSTPKAHSSRVLEGGLQIPSPVASFAIYHERKQSDEQVPQLISQSRSGIGVSMVPSSIRSCG